MAFNIITATNEELIKEYDECEKLWGKYSSDCFGFYLKALHKEISLRKLWLEINQRTSGLAETK